VIILGKKAVRINITLPPDVLEEFKKYGERKGVMISPFVAAKMKEFIEEEKAIEKLKSEKKF
jgi:metal-responsive CopG/Arc/MetJ family transcriptional regulator